MPNLKSSGPWKGLLVGPEWRGILLVPCSAMKIWFCHWMHEGHNRESWPSIETISAMTGLGEDTVFTYRKWLVEHGWLVAVGRVPARHGHFSVPKFRVERGTVPEKTGDGRENNRVGKLPAPTHRKTSSTVAPEKIRPEVEPSFNYNQGEPDNPNQSIHPSSKGADAPQNLSGNSKATETGSPVPSQRQPQEQEGVDELVSFFPRCPATPENLAMLRAIHGRLEHEPVGLDDVLRYNWAHHEGKLRLRSLRQAHNAIVNGSAENGVVVQALTHNEEDCRVCRKRKVTMDKEEVVRAKADPLWKIDPVTEARSLKRNPNTVAERRELIALRGKSKIRWEYIAPFLMQKNCAQCHGWNSNCECVMKEELL
jgi:hypothetical protein